MTTTAAIETHLRRPVRSAEDCLSESVETRRTMQTFVSHIAWESEVWIAEDPDHMIHFNGERFLGPYPDVTTITRTNIPNTIQ